MKDYQFVKVPMNLFYLMDANTSKVLITLIQMFDFYPKHDGYFECSYKTLELACGLSQNLIKASLAGLFLEGIIDVISVGKGRGKHTNRYKVNVEKFKDYEKTPVGIAIMTEDKPIHQVKYKGERFQVPWDEKPIEKQSEKGTEKKVTTNINNTDNTNNIRIDNTVLNNKPIEEKEMKQPTQELVQGGSPSNHLNDFTVEDINQLPYMERVLEKKYQRIQKNIPGVEKTHPGAYIGDGLPNYTREVSDFTQHHDTTTMTNLFVEWYDGGREKIAELVQGLSQQAIDGILKHYNNEAARLEPVYSI